MSAVETTRTQSNTGAYVLRKLPHITLLFWVLKTIAVTLGETAGDEFGITLKVGYAQMVGLFLVFFLVVAAAQVWSKRFHPALYWAVILSTSLVGTEISDFMNRGFGHASNDAGGIGYTAGGAILTTILVIVFLVWWRTGQTFDVENIATRKGEILYWIAILVSNTLGTSSGDVLAHDTPLGFRGAFFVLSAVMLLLTAAHYLTPINGTVIFWVAFVLTRPLGAAGGDALTKPTATAAWAGGRWALRSPCSTYSCCWSLSKRSCCFVDRSASSRTRCTAGPGSRSRPTARWCWRAAAGPSSW